MADKQQLDNLRHSCAHLLAAAVMELWPKTKRTIGPAIENGFYFDFDFDNQKVTEEDFPKIEAKMREILPSWESFEKHELNAQEAKKEYPDNQYKHELIDEFSQKGETLTFYKSGNYWDLCRGGHTDNPKEDLKHFKLTTVAGAYWRGSEKNKMLTRIYGTAFPTEKELENYLAMLEEAKKRDHKKLGLAHDLFFFHQTSPGMAYWLPNGLTLYNLLINFSKKVHKDFGYMEVASPQLNKKELYETSGHWQHYRDDMFISPMSYINKDSKDVLEGTEVFGIKPMNCPNAMNIFSHTTRSYKDLPLRLAETSQLHRFELSGTLNGLFRTREFRQDDAHVFIAPNQLKEEFQKIMQMIDIFYSAFKLEYRLRFGTRPENFMGDKKDWDEAEKSLQMVLDESKKDYTKEEGEGAFYGPKVDILMKDSLGREWQTGTIQLDFQQPKNFKLKYIDDNGKETTPSVLHRAIYGSFERFLAILTEHYAASFPTWLSPTQVIVLPISDKFTTYAQKVTDSLSESDVRVDLDNRNERLQAKIRDATIKRIPYIIIVGEKEQESEKVAVRTREGKDLGTMAIADIVGIIAKEIENMN